MAVPFKYPWDKWFLRRRRFTLKQGRDFDIQVHGMANMIRNHASRKKKSVSLKINDDSIEVQIHHA